MAVRDRRRQRVGQRRVLAAGRDVEAEREVRGLRRPALGDAAQAHEQGRVAQPRRAQRRRQLGLQERVEVARREQEGELVGVVVERLPPHAGGVEERAAQGPAVQPGDQRAHVGHRIARDPSARAVPALLAQDAREVAVRVEQEGVGPVRPDDRVEDEPVDVVGEGARVRERHVGPVGDPHQRDALDAEGLAQLVDIEDRVGGRVEGARGADAVGARRQRRGQERVERAQALDARAVQEARLAGAALVEHGEPVAPQRRLQRERERRRRADRRLARPARERDEHRRRAASLDRVVDRDLARHRARPIERHVEDAATEGGLPRAAPEGGRRGRGGRRRDERGDGESGGEDGAQRTATVHGSTGWRGRTGPG
jgi:hypothetical protein